VECQHPGAKGNLPKRHGCSAEKSLDSGVRFHGGVFYFTVTQFSKKEKCGVRTKTAEFTENGMKKLREGEKTKKRFLLKKFQLSLLQIFGPTDVNDTENVRALVKFVIC
jgi:hypothetical protein